LANRLPRQVKLFGAVSLLNDFASEMVYPLLPAFVTGVLGGGPLALGALDGAADFASSAVKYGSGRLADRPARRRPLVLAGYAVAVVVRPLIAFTGAAWQVIALRVTDRLGKGARTPARDAMIADGTPGELHGRAFGLQRGLDHAGAVLGPLAAWALLTWASADVRSVILASLLPGIAVLVLAWWAVRDRGAGAAGGGTERQALPPGAAAGRLVPPGLLPIVAFYLLRMPETLLILRSQQLGVPVAAVPLLWAAVHVAKSLVSFAGGALSDAIGPRRTMWLGWAGYAGIAAGFGGAQSPEAAWGLFLAFGGIVGLTESPERALVARVAGTRSGSGFGIYHALSGLAALAGGLGLGALYQAAGPAAAFLASTAAAVALVALTLAIRLARAETPARL